jgi:hypothetical protein
MTKRTLLLGLAGLAGFLGLRWGASSDAAPAKKFEIEKSDDEWRRILSSGQYNVLHWLRSAAVLIRHKIRERDRLAKLLPTACRRGRDDERPFLSDEPHRGALRPMRRTPRARFRRRSAADWLALLHERCRAQV